MENSEKMVNFTPNKDEWLSAGEIVDFDAEAAKRAQREATIRKEALARGVEPFDVDAVMERFFPDDLTDNVDKIKKNISDLETEYYLSGAHTVDEWAKFMEKYEADKDSTGDD